MRGGERPHGSQAPAGADLARRYERLRERMRRRDDFHPDDLRASRDLFEERNGELLPRAFDVWTLLAGLPAPDLLTRSLTALAAEVAALLPAEVRFYRVEPATYHWETFILQRPDESLTAPQRRAAMDLAAGALATAPPFTLTYRGWLLTPDGTLIACGHGPIDGLRDSLRRHIPWASPRQSELGHISLGRILDPVGASVFSRLLQRMESQRERDLGAFPVEQVSYVHETRWYMLERRELAVFPFRGGRKEEWRGSCATHLEQAHD